ncbi:MAG: hypothetical protein EXR31_04385 [Betaproteobacteria bacterium]|nr:hypothetical protein [Betaproteobacteria bacterium]
MRPILVLLLLALSPHAQAARPFVTDDARIVDPDGWQIESFVKQQNRFKEREFWFLPAHNPGDKLFGGRVELTLGRYWVNSPANGDNQATLMQAKTLLKPLETNGYGYALTLGAARVGPFQQRHAWNPYFNGIASFSFADDRVVLHTNLGGVRDRPANRARATWGAGAEVMLIAPRIIGIVESYGQSGEKPTFHTGLRIWAIPNRWQIDATMGFQDASPNRRFASVGMRFLF